MHRERVCSIRRILGAICDAGNRRLAPKETCAAENLLLQNVCDGWDNRGLHMSGLRFESMADMPPRMRELYARQVAPAVRQAQQKGEKYQNQMDERSGIKFDSKKEARRYDELMTMLRGGIITDLRLQPQFTLQESYITELGERIRAIRYTADFSYRLGGQLVVEDVKSAATRTKEYMRNKKIMRSKYGIDIQEV